MYILYIRADNIKSQEKNRWRRTCLVWKDNWFEVSCTMRMRSVSLTLCDTNM